MIVYHGSNSRFDTLRISKRLVRSSSTLLNEGMGIYFSTDRKIAETYGKYLYTLELNDAKLLDMRQRSVVTSYIHRIAKEIYKSTGLDITMYIDIGQVAQYVVDGRVAIIGICREIYLLLDSNESWYIEAGEKLVVKVNELLRQMENRKIPSYLFNYHIPNIGVIKVVTPEVVRIISREKIA